MNVKALLALGATAALLSACLSGGDSTTSASGTGQPINPSETPLQLSEFSVANGCFGLQSAFSRRFVQPAAARYAAGPATQAENFTMRPTELGKYLIYGSDRQMITAQGNTLVASAGLQVRGEPLAHHADTIKVDGWNLKPMTAVRTEGA